MTALLETRRVGKQFGPLCALDDVSFTIAAGEVVSVVGPNGAGKTTLVNRSLALKPTAAGAVHGRRYRRARSVTLADRGLARAFQLIAIFPPIWYARLPRPRCVVAEVLAAVVAACGRPCD